MTHVAWTRLRAAADMLLVAVGYYAGALVGFALTLSPQPVSTVWPPNAILLAALLLSPPGRWGWLLVAALPAHLLAELQSGVPLVMVLCWFVTNAGQALVGAAGVRRVGGDVRFDSVRGVTVFVAFAAVLAPFVTSFADVAFVRLVGWGGGDYWPLWRMRFLSNVLTTLTLAPVIVTVSAHGLPWPHRRWRWRHLEAGLQFAGVVAAGLLAFGHESTEDGRAPALLYAPLPFLLWAAVRLGIGGVSASVLTITLLSIWGVMHHRGPFTAVSPADNVMSMQVFHILVTVTLMYLAAVIQEREAAERALRLSEGRSRRLIDSNVIGVVIAEGSGLVTDANDEFLRMVEYSRDDLRGRRVRWEALVAEEERDADAQAIRDLLAHRVSAPVETEYVAKGGRRIPVLRGAARLDDPPESWIAFILDLTQRKQTEEALRQTRAELADITRRTTVGGLAGSIAHEINQPLAAMVANANAGLRWLARDQPELAEAREAVRAVIRDATRATSVIVRIRAFLRKSPGERAPLNLSHIIREVLLLLQPELLTHRIALGAVLADDLPPILGDRVQLQQAVLNLLMNAVEAMAAVTDRRRDLLVTARRDQLHGEPAVLVVVEDTGVGFGAESGDRLFEAFYTTKPNGLGMGLSISRSIVEAHGGRLWAVPGARHGAILRFVLPAAGHPPST